MATIRGRATAHDSTSPSPPFFSTVATRKQPKLYCVDPGLVRAVKKQFGRVAVEERGTLLEGWVLTLLRAHGEECELYDNIFY